MQLLSIEDLAAYLGDSKRTIYKYIASGDCPPYIRISAKNIKFDRADVDAWLESKKVYPDSGGKKMSNLSLLNNSTCNNKLPWMPRAKKVLKIAEKQAPKDGFDLIGTEHILFGIVSIKECIGAMVLNNLNLDSTIFQKLYEQLCQPSNEKISGKIKLSDDADKLIQYAHQQADEWGHNYIGTEHLLVGILLAGKGTGFEILTNSNITLDKVKEETGKLIVRSNTQIEK